MNELIRLYQVFNPSIYEGDMINFVMDKLDSLGIHDYTVDTYGQIYRFNDGEPLICAHMDSVSTKRARGIVIDKVKGTIKGKSNLGADDKNGIWIMFRLLEQRPNLSFIFSVEEEIGGKISELPLDELSNVPYGLIFDRKGGSDIIGTENDYCKEDLEDVIAELGVEYGYKPCRGVLSDCDTLYEYLACVNLSCGYYKAHTDEEYTVIAELENALNFGLHLIDNVPRVRYELAEKRFYSYGYGNYSTSWPDWMCECGTINKGYMWNCVKCDGNSWDNCVAEYEDNGNVIYLGCNDDWDNFEEDDDVCEHCGEKYSSAELCAECEYETILHFTVNDQEHLN